MSLPAGTRIGPYEVVSMLGAGGMGEVYRARDTKLQRDVALKMLAAVCASDPDRLARFAREARLLATLNHPHIGAIYGLEESDGLSALVLELVEGPTLGERLGRGPLPVDEALSVAKQIAAALEAAHEQGIMHRDLKPSNIKLRPDGVVKVMDFGIAKAYGPNVADPEGLASTTSLATESGALLGTAAYMSPEQARGDVVDKRTDIWSFGCVLYELLTGECAFKGKTVLGTLAAVLAPDTPLQRLPASTPPAIRRLLHRCLERDAKRRLRDIGEARIAIDDIVSGVPAVSEIEAVISEGPRRKRFASYGALLVAVTTAAVGSATATWLVTRTTPPMSAVRPRLTRLPITVPSATPLRTDASRVLTISPDGTRLAYVGGSANARQIFVRAVNQLDPTPVTARYTRLDELFFSPDGQWVGFFLPTENTLKKIGVNGGPEVILCRPDNGFWGATWSADGSIIFATSTGLWRIPEDGGPPAVLARLNGTNGRLDHFWRSPEVLPGGRLVLVTVQPKTRSSEQQVAILDLQTGAEKVIVQSGSNPHYVSTGHLLYAVGETIRAVGFDRDRLETIGMPVPVLAELLNTGGTRPHFDIADDGTLVYVRGGVRTVGRELVWVDRRGREEEIKVPPRAYVHPRISPDGTRVLLDASDQEDDIWIWNFTQETLERFTFGSSRETDPLWMPNGRRVVFHSDRDGQRNIFWAAADNPGRVERLTRSPNIHVPSSVSPDGTRMLVIEIAAKAPPALMMLLLGKDGQMQPVLKGAYAVTDAELSPDGQWLAYVSWESKQAEIHIRPFPDVNSGHWQVSNGGGTQPLWARNSRELFYVDPNAAVVGVRIGGGRAWKAATPSKLLEPRYFLGATTSMRMYDLDPDGRRFLMIKQRNAALESSEGSFVIVQNWFEELKQRVPTH